MKQKKQKNKKNPKNKVHVFRFIKKWIHKKYHFVYFFTHFVILYNTSRLELFKQSFYKFSSCFCALIKRFVLFPNFNSIWQT